MFGLTKFLRRLTSDNESDAAGAEIDVDDSHNDDGDAPANIEPFFHSEKERNGMQQMYAMREVTDTQTGVQFSAYASEEQLLRCLRARKYEVPLAQVLFRNLALWLHSMGAPSAAPSEVFSARSLKPHLDLQFARLTGARTRDGHAILYLRLANGDMSVSRGIDYVRVLYYLVDVALRSPHTQARGICIIHDMGGLTLGKLDPSLPRKILGCIQNRFPMRVAKVLIVRPPWFFALVFPIVRRFMKAKMQRRVHQLGDDPRALLEHVDEANLLEELGGRLKFDYPAWLAARLREEGAR